MRQITAFAPASVSNVACGFDIMGFAIESLGDEVTLTLNNKGSLEITEIIGDGGILPYEIEKNTATTALLAMMEELDINKGISVKINKKLPLLGGLGSSAVSPVAAVFALNELLSLNLTIDQLLKYAVRGEMTASKSLHADNVAPSLYGGFILIRSYNPVDIIKIPVPENLYCSIIRPNIRIKTEEARKILKPEVKMKDLITQTGNAAGLIAGLFMSDYQLIGRSLHDVVVEPVRASLIPGFYEIKKAAMDAGALGCSISGSGPSIFALCSTFDKAVETASAMRSALEKIKLENDIYVTKINNCGPKIIK